MSKTDTKDKKQRKQQLVEVLRADAIVNSEIDGDYTIERADRSAMSIIPKRKPAVRPYPGLTMDQSNFVFQGLAQQFGYEDYLDCWSFEMVSRAIPYVTDSPKAAGIVAICEKYGPYIFERMLASLHLYQQTINKTSAFGDPIFGNPNAAEVDRMTLDEKTALMNMATSDLELRRLMRQVATSTATQKEQEFEYFALMFDEGDFSSVKNGIVRINTRGQYEIPSKIRTARFLARSGVYEAQVDRRRLAEPLNGLHGLVKIPRRERNVFGPDIANNYLQAVDTQFHSWMANQPVCDANVFAITPNNFPFRSFDCKHHERIIGAVLPTWAKLIGGLYEQQLLRMYRAPFLCPYDDWSGAALITVNHRPGRYVQLGSGLCPVASLGKFAPLCARIAFYAERKGLDIQSAVDACFLGEYEGLRHWNYGDDNLLRGPEAAVNELIKFMGEVFDIEEDQHPSYLGAAYSPDQMKFILRDETYVIKYGQRERDWTAYAFPYYGFMQRRDDFRQKGSARLSREIISAEDALLEQTGFPIWHIAQLAQKEKDLIAQLGLKLPINLIREKDYLLSEDEQLKSGLWFGRSPARTLKAFNNLVGEHIRNKVQWQ